jgi:hypothetical protein
LRVGTHRAMTRAAAHAAGLRDGPVLDAMLSGVASPDMRPEEEVQARVSRSGRVYFVRRRVRHHTVRNKGRMMRAFWRARKLWLRGKSVEAAYWLGYGLHYLQDSYVTARNHLREENEAWSAPIPLSLISSAAKSSKPSPSFIKRVVASAAPMGSGRAALESASVATALIIPAVLADAAPPSTLVEEYREMRGMHVVKTALSAAFAAAAALALPAFPPLSLILAGAAIAAYVSDGKYRAVKGELNWFRP